MSILLAALREASHDERFANEAAADLRRMTTDAATETAQSEAARWAEQARKARTRIGSILTELRGQGAEVEDATLGLITFFSARRDETVLLTYRGGDEDFLGWRTLTTRPGNHRPMADY